MAPRYEDLRQQRLDTLPQAIKGAQPSSIGLAYSCLHITLLFR